MSLNIVAGKSNSGKSEYIYRSMLKDLSSGKHAILFVPPMARVLAEKEYIDCLNVNDITGVTITTIDRYIKNKVSNMQLYKAKEYLPDMARKIYIKHLIQKYQGELNIFAKAKESNSFVDLLYSYMDIFEKEKITRQEIEEKYPANDFTKSKLLEICNIYEKINGESKEKFIDSLDETNIYIQKIESEGHNEYVDKKIYFDSYNNFSKSEYAYIQSLLKLGVDVTISINMPMPVDENIEGGIFTESYNTYTKLKDLAQKVGCKFHEMFLEQKENILQKDITYLANNIFDVDKTRYTEKTENINIYLVPNPYEELAYIAKDIMEKVNNKGARYRDFVIYTSNIEEYYLCIKRIFGKYNIPVFCNSKEYIQNSKIAKYITLLLDICTNGLEYRENNKLLGLLKTGFLGIKEEDINIFENYLDDLNIKGYMLNKKFTKNVDKMQEYEYDLEQVNSVRAEILEKIEGFKQEIQKSRTSKDITKVIYEYLAQNNVISQVEKDIESIELESTEERQKQKQILGKIYEIMDNICQVTDEITIEEYLKLLKYGLEEERVLTIPALIDQVEVCDINKTRNIVTDFGYIIGVNENSIPSGDTQDSTFTEIELEKIKGLGLNIKKTSIDKMNMELFNIYLAISKCKKNLTILIPSSKITGEALRISSVVREIQDLMEISINSIEETKDNNLKEDIFNSVIYSLKENGDIDKSELAKIYTNYCYLKEHHKYGKIFAYERIANKLSEDITKKLYPQDVNLSVSRLESLKRCPFAYYSKYVLSLKNKKEYKLSKLDMGSIMHVILEKISRELTAKNIKWSDIPSNENYKQLLKDNIDKTVDDIFEREYSKHEENIRLEILKINLKKSMLKIILSIADSILESSFEPIGYEIAFDKNALFAPIKVELDEGKTVYLRGKIDRIDMAKINNAAYFRIIDYKSSNKKLSLSDIKEGLSLQLITYMSAILDNKDKVTDMEKVVPAALNYFTLNTSLVNLTEYENNEKLLKKKIIEAVKLKGIYIKDVDILKKMDNNLESPDKSYIDVNLKNIANGEKYLLEEIFINECENVKDILKKLSTEIIKGNVKIEPNDVKNCEYCEYSSICRRKNCV